MMSVPYIMTSVLYEMQSRFHGSARRRAMRITVFGATGGVGGHVVRQALDAGHQVTAVVRDVTRLRLEHPALTVATMADALEPCDAVLSGIGPKGRKEGPVASTATRGILRAMADAGVRR